MISTVVGLDVYNDEKQEIGRIKDIVLNQNGQTQALDGIGAGLQSVAVPGLVARMLNGTGRVNVGQGAVMTFQGVGAALSPAIGGWLAQDLGYPAAFTSMRGEANQ